MCHSSLRLLAQKPLILAALVTSSFTAQSACASAQAPGSWENLPAPLAIPAIGPSLPVINSATPRTRPTLSRSNMLSEPASTVYWNPKDTVNAPPPGLVLIPGGRTVIGTDVDDIKDILVENYSERKMAGAYIAETPQFKREVPEFALMVTEVTNEQFAAYVSATGSRPPELWGNKAIDAASTEFLKAEGLKRQKAKEEGRPIRPRQTFDRQRWWDENWKDAEWEVPKGHEHKPVVYVDYADAQNYARWAGLRLPTEFEYVRAARGDTSDSYTWGPEWKEKHAVTGELVGNKETFVVGSFKDGATKEGVYDLIGNAWEWTSSPFTPFPKYKQQTFKLGKGKDADKISAVANWDANKRVCVGGGYHQTRFTSRCTIRRGASRTQTADAQTFRCAASRAAGIDIAERLVVDEVDVNSRPSNQAGIVQYTPIDTLAVDRWQHKTLAEADRPVPGYEVITGYDYITFTPVDKLSSVDVNDLTKRILEEGPEPLGFISTNQRILSPDLEPGTYMISYRCPGKRREDNSMKAKGKNGGKKKPDEPTGEEPEEESTDPWDLGAYETKLGLDEDKGYFLFFNTDVELVGHIEAMGFDKKAGKVTSPGSATFFDKTYTVTEEDENGDEVEVEVREQWLRFDANLRARAARRGFLATIAVQVEKDLDASSFRVSKGK